MTSENCGESPKSQLSDKQTACIMVTSDPCKLKQRACSWGQSGLGTEHNWLQCSGPAVSGNWAELIKGTSDVGASVLIRALLPQRKRTQEDFV